MMMKDTLRVISTLLLMVIATASISIRDRKLVDEEGREIRIHGTNVVVKVPPYMPRIDEFDPEWSFSRKDMEDCRSFGFNGIRLGMMWAGVEPTSSGYNETYLDEMERLINMAGQYGIYTLIDFHQDLIAEKFCGDGIPTWLVDELKLYKTFPFPTEKPIKLNSSGLPSWSDCNTAQWGKYYFSYDVGQTFRELYKPGTKLNRKFTDFWVKLATRFRGNKYVLGYELINEPFVGNAIRDVPLVVPSVAEKVHFQEFYDRLAIEIRKVDPETIIFFEPITFDQTVPVGFSHPPGGNAYRNKSVLSYHYYHPPARNVKTIDARVQDAERLGVVGFLSEFGGASGDVLGLAMKYQQSWLYWHYKSYGKGWGNSQFMFSNSQSQVKYPGSVNENRTMTYLQRISGEVKQENYNFKTKEYYVTYFATPNKTSILYYSKQFNYKNGYNIEVTPSQQLEYKEEEVGYIQLTLRGSSSEQSRLVQVKLTPL